MIGPGSDESKVVVCSSPCKVPPYRYLLDRFIRYRKLYIQVNGVELYNPKQCFPVLSIETLRLVYTNSLILLTFYQSGRMIDFFFP